MKLATYRDGSRDGQLVVVSADLTLAHHASGIATRLQQVLDDWNFLAPQLQDLARTLALGKARHAFPFEPRMCMAPLPRACRLVDADLAPGVARIGSEMAGDAMTGPHGALPQAEPGTALDFAARLVLALGDVPRGAAQDQARDGVRLLMLACHWQHVLCGPPRAWLDASMAWAPVALTPDELGRDWRRGRLALALSTSVDGTAQPPAEASPASVPEAGALVAGLARHRAVTAGTLLALPGPQRTALDGAAQIEIDARDGLGQSVFGAILQRHRSDDDRAVAG
ncbi:fumarylacetoacetate hydrolase [Sphaerotilus sp.]|uniref:fumarylacetoacetate hydrolase n=1 Tax=Sphaerotilus sp. TaxID=2093942 RepID=UPI002ACF0641|nr:fumarylacetoacetate hydrolase [Sphaerotilus sp.]MDZ7856405.1 fumarylacetoacetate hydrolase [Sphaerotilus sp.]